MTNSSPHLVRPVVARVGLVLALWFAVAPISMAGDFRINELMYRNDTWTDAGFLDEDGSREGWVELKNVGVATASLAGWSLSDDVTVVDRFVLPDVSVDAGETVIVWLSGKDRSDSASPLHTNFLVASAQDVLLFDAAGQLEDTVGGGQAVPIDHSIGRCAELAGVPGYYFATPSPGAENHYFGVVPFVFAEDHVSLTVGEPLQLRVWPDIAVTWSSDNPNVSVSATGVIEASQDALSPDGQAVITATLAGGSWGASVNVTIVSWTANVSRAVLVPDSTADRVLAQDDTGVYFSVGLTLYKSASGGLMEDAQQVGSLPGQPSSMGRLLLTPFGNFLNVGARVYAASDLSNWTVAIEMESAGLRHMLDAYWDAASQTGYVFAGEYSSTDPSRRHKVHRGTYPNQAAPAWDIVLDFPSLADWQNDPANVDAVRHIHVVVIDPQTGDVFVGTGDANEHSRIYWSGDFGSTFELLGMGLQDWRALAIWFSDDFVYWNMDTSAPQSIWRIPRTAYLPVTGWPSITPELASGNSVPGVRYYVSENEAPGRFPVSKGEVFVETTPTVLDSTNRLRPIDDPAFDYRQEVALIDNGAQWYQGFVRSEQGDLISLVSVEPGASYRRDERARLFGIKEDVNGDPIVQELGQIEPEQTNPLSFKTQLIPKAQDLDGLVYFASVNSAHQRYRARVDWYDDAASAPAPPTPSPLPDLCLPVPEPSTGALWAGGMIVLSCLGHGRRRRLRGRSARA